MSKLDNCRQVANYLHRQTNEEGGAYCNGIQKADSCSASQSASQYTEIATFLPSFAPRLSPLNPYNGIQYQRSLLSSLTTQYRASSLRRTYTAIATSSLQLQEDARQSSREKVEGREIVERHEHQDLPLCLIRYVSIKIRH